MDEQHVKQVIAKFAVRSIEAMEPLRQGAWFALSNPSAAVPAPP
ncbi:hypothetical protein [Paraburkholderia strydomiana]